MSRPLAAHQRSPAIGRAAAIEIVGGKRVFESPPQSRAEVHRALVRGVPYAMLLNLVAQLGALSPDDVAAAVGISARTLRRHQEHPDRTMPPDLASRTWQLAEVLAQAGTVFGSHAAALAWLAVPAMGLDGVRPIELLRTLQGTELVTEFLGRLEHGVYT